jgi:hypothetical protein
MLRNAARTIALATAICLASPALADPEPAPAAEAAAPADPARVAAARELLEVTGVTKQMDNMVDAMTSGFAKGAQADKSEVGKKISEQFDQSMKKLLGYKDQMISDFADLYARKFTVEEMKSVTDFYRSGAGAKFIAMTPELMKEGAAIGMKYSQKIVDEMKAAAPNEGDAKEATPPEGDANKPPEQK